MHKWTVHVWEELRIWGSSCQLCSPDLAASPCWGLQRRGDPGHWEINQKWNRWIKVEPGELIFFPLGAYMLLSVR